MILYCTRDKNVRKNFCPGSEAMSIIVASLADSICRHPDVTLESGLVLNTIGQL